MVWELRWLSSHSGRGLKRQFDQIPFHQLLFKSSSEMTFFALVVWILGSASSHFGHVLECLPSSSSSRIRMSRFVSLRALSRRSLRIASLDWVATTFTHYMSCSEKVFLIVMVCITNGCSEPGG
jgi:hypothetical protein